MKLKIVAALLFLAAVSLIAACRSAGTSGSDKVIKSTKSGDMTIGLSNATGELKNGENDLMITFTDASGKPVDQPDLAFIITGFEPR
jgi:hypothetical protein